MDIKATLINQIEMLEKVQAEALSNGDMKKVEEISMTIISVTNNIKALE